MKKGIYTLKDFLTPEFIERIKRRRQLKHEFYVAQSIQKKWGVIRQAYSENLPRIMAAAERSKWGMIDPYFLDWAPFMSPIEFDAWWSIREKGLPFYPQFPLFNYFIDFANPYLRIGVELDGKDWHDEAKDRERDERLASHGWHIYRIKGSECFAKSMSLYEIACQQSEYGMTDYEANLELRKYYSETSDGIIESIEIVYFQEDGNPDWSHAYRSLDMHRLAQFEIGR